MSRPIILVSNDDGIQSKGIRVLIDAILDAAGPEGADIYAVAPLHQQSGQSSAITVINPLRPIPFPSYRGATMFGVTGTPVDCVKLALHTLLPGRPDFMFSGINHGSNAGCNAIYSGTMGAAMETCMQEIPSIAFSLLDHHPDADFTGVYPFVVDLARKCMAGKLPADVCLNINMPAHCTPLGVKTVRAARGYWTDEYEAYTDPHGYPFYLLSGHFHNIEPDNDATDEYWLARNYISVVPVRPDQTALDAIEAVAELVK